MDILTVIFNTVESFCCGAIHGDHAFLPDGYALGAVTNCSDWAVLVSELDTIGSIEMLSGGGWICSIGRSNIQSYIY